MNVKSTVVRVTLTSLAAGALLVGGLSSVSIASADEKIVKTEVWAGTVVPATPPTPAVPTAQVPQPVTRYFYNYYNPYTGQVAYYANGVPGHVYNYTNFAYNSYAWLSYYNQYSQFHYNQFGYNQSVSSSVIAASAVALNLTTQDVTNRLASGKTLAQIAADRGVARHTFVNAVNSILQAQINNAVAGRLISPAVGVNLSGAVASQVNIIVDRYGPSVLAGI